MEKYITIDALEWDYEQETGIYRSGDFAIVPLEADGEVLYCTLYNGKEWGGEPVGSLDAAVYATQEEVERMVKKTMERGSREQDERNAIFLGEVIHHARSEKCMETDYTMTMIGDFYRECVKEAGLTEEEADALVVANMKECGTWSEDMAFSDDEEE